MTTTSCIIPAFTQTSARTVFLESSGRYRKIFEDTPPTIFAQFVPLDSKVTTAIGYAWFVWEKQTRTAPRLA
jgi:hypothetical protein